MNNSNHIDQQVERALVSVILSEDAKYRVINKIYSASSHGQKHTGRKLSSAAVIAVTLVSLLVITAAAVGGLSYFKAIYGDKAETLTPYGVTIGTNVQNNDVVLTLHESVADDYATAYIFSIKGLTDAGKAIVVSNTLDPNADETTFAQTNTNKAVWPDNKFQDEQGNYIKPTVIPPEITDCKIYNLQQKTSSGDFMDYSIGLRYDGTAYDTTDNTAYTIIPVESLREENCEYYALYVITLQMHPLTLTFDDLELSLPEATTRIPGTEVTFDGYIQDYFLTEEGMSKIMSEYPTSAVLTPLGLYVNDSHTRSFMYKYATLTFNGGSEQELSGISNEKMCAVSWKPNYFPLTYKGAVYLFNEIMDISTVKSLLFYDEIEFPFDGSAPSVRSSGRTLNSNNPKLLIWKIAEEIRNYVIEVCPDPRFVTVPYSDEPIKVTDWSEIQYWRNGQYLVFGRTVNGIDYDFYISYNTTKLGGTPEENFNIITKSKQVTVLAEGTYEGAKFIALEYSKPAFSDYKRCIYALYEGNLWTIEYRADPDLPNDYAFDALLDLIK